jgi:hypothetical protein
VVVVAVGWVVVVVVVEVEDVVVVDEVTVVVVDSVVVVVVVVGALHSVALATTSPSGQTNCCFGWLPGSVHPQTRTIIERNMTSRIEPNNGRTGI